MKNFVYVAELHTRSELRNGFKLHTRFNLCNGSELRNRFELRNRSGPCCSWTSYVAELRTRFELNGLELNFVADPNFGFGAELHVAEPNFGPGVGFGVELHMWI